MLKIFPAPLALGSYSDGVEQGPAAILHESLLHALQHNSLEAEVLEPVEVRHEPTSKGRLRNYDAVTEFNKELRAQILQHTQPGDVALTLGGDHAVGFGSMFATKQRFADACVVYIDAHPDCSNPDETLTGNLHGMPLSTVLGDALYGEFGGLHYGADEVIIMGAKDVDAHEAEYLQRKGIRVVSMDAIIERGIAYALEEVNKLVGGRPVHVALDIDAIDETEAPGTGIINQGGLSFREVSYLCRKLALLKPVAVDVVEVNPARDEQLKTVHLATELAMYLLGGEWSRYDRYLLEH